MSLNETIDALATGTYTVTRRLVGTYTDGVYSGPGASSTFSISAVLSPATGLGRVFGGFEMITDESGRKIHDIRVLYTRTELYTPNGTYEADLVTLNGRQYTVYIVEPWDLAYYETSNEKHYKVLLTRVTGGST